MNFRAFPSVGNDRQEPDSVRPVRTGAEMAEPPHLHLEIRGYVENVYLVRSLADQAADMWGLSDDVREAARLILTELVTNASAACPGRTVRAAIVLLGPGAVEARVWDPDGRREPRLRPADLLDETGRGLAIVTALSGGRCGWYRTNPSGKVIWAKFGGTL